MKLKISAMLIGLVVLLLTACQVTAPGQPVGPAPAQPAESASPTATAPAEDTPLPAAAESDADCPVADAQTQRLMNAKHGYCLLYPIGYKVEKPSETETSLVIGSLLNTQDPRADISVTPAEGRTAEQVATQLIADYSVPGVPAPEQFPINIGGQEAIMVDRLMGQDINRRVVFIHEDHLYSLFFSPLVAEDSDLQSRFEDFYAQVINSFTFIPQSDEVVEECVEPIAGTQLFTNEAHGYCLLYPEGYNVEQPVEQETVFYVGSLLDVEHPKLFIEVSDAAGQTATEIAEGLIADVAATLPDYQVESSFGLTIGYETTEVLYKMPGQELSRQVIAVHNGRVYKLTFVPDDEAADETYQAMETLYTTVTNNFRFLP